MATNNKEDDMTQWSGEFKNMTSFIFDLFDLISSNEIVIEHQFAFDNKKQYPVDAQFENQQIAFKLIIKGDTSDVVRILEQRLHASIQAVDDVKKVVKFVEQKQENNQEQQQMSLNKPIALDLDWIHQVLINLNVPIIDLSYFSKNKEIVFDFQLNEDKNPTYFINDLRLFLEADNNLNEFIVQHKITQEFESLSELKKNII